MTDTSPAAIAASPRILVKYINWRGETSKRIIAPLGLWWGRTEYHPEDQWMLTAYDAEKDVVRHFAWQDMAPIANDATSSAVQALADERGALVAETAQLRDAPFPDDDGFYGLISAAVLEARKAMRKYPQPNYVITKVAEEAGEVVKAAIHCAESRESYENLRGELVQLIAMIYRLWIEGDQIHGLSPVRAALQQETPNDPRD